MKRKYDGDIKERRRRAAAEHRKNHPEKSHQQWVSSRQRHMEKRAGRAKPKSCELCGRDGRYGERDRICFDHDHVTGQFRGWLCHHCNLILGHAEDDPILLRKLADYLDKHAPGGSNDHGRES